MQTVFKILTNSKIYLPIFYIAIGIILYNIIKIILDKIFYNKIVHPKQKKRVTTIRILFKNITKYTLGIIVFLAVLTVYNVDVNAILAGLGIVGLVFGLATQDIIKDLLSGISIILENQYMIGDVIEINGFKGEVKFLGLRTTRIQNYKGEMLILSNRNINQVINYSTDYSLAIVDVSVAYESDLNQVEKCLQKIASEFSNKLPKIKENIEILGINQLDDSAVVYQIRAKAEANNQYQIERELKKQIKLAFDKEKIKIPYTQIEVHHGE